MLKDIFAVIFYNGIFASVLAAVVMLIRAVSRKRCNRIMCLIWGCVAIRLIIPYSIGKTILVPDYRNNEVSYVESVGSVEKLKESDPIATIDFEKKSTETKTADFDGARLQNISGVLTAIIPYIWVIGTTFLMGFHLLSAILLRRRLKICLKEEDYYLCDTIGVPFVLGLLKPKVFIPSFLEEPIKTKVITHEKCHIRQGDTFWMALATILVTVYWIQPLIWMAFFLFIRDLEMSCDDEVTADYDWNERKDYTEALVTIADRRLSKEMLINGFTNGSIKGRVKNIMRKDEYRKSKKIFIALLGILLLGLTLFIGVKHVMKTKTNEPEKQPEITKPVRLAEEDYYKFPAENGLTVFVWEMAENSYYCGLMPGTDRNAMKYEDLFEMGLRQGTTVETMKKILASYNLPEDMIAVEPFSNPISSYVNPEHTSDNPEYRAFLRSLFFP